LSHSTGPVESFFKCLLVIYTSFESCSIHLPIYYLDSLFFWCLIFWALSIFWIWVLCQIDSRQRFSPILLAVSLMCSSFLIWCNSICQMLLLFPELVEACSESPYLCLHLEVFSLTKFNVSGLTLRSLIYFELIFAIRWEIGSSFSLVHVDIQFSQQHFLESPSFLQCLLLVLLSRIKWL
jgi:hypothetical protein